jgi:hydrogenase nickel incorporation protein HypB
MFSNSDCLVVNKYDMIQYFDFNYSKVCVDAKNVNPQITIFPVSSSAGSGIYEFAEWLGGRVSLKVK